MIIRSIARPASFIAVVCAFGLIGQSNAATAKKTIPSAITTEKGKTYQSAQLISTAPDGLVIQYKPQDGGVGMTKVRFRDLPENLRRDFNYDENAASEFEAASRQVVLQREENTAKIENRTGAAEASNGQRSSAAVDSSAEERSAGLSADAYPVGRFRAAGTIRGAMIVDTITGEAWLVDLHSVLEDYKDRSYFLQPKVVLGE